MTKKVASFFRGKIGATPSVAAPGDTDPSDATNTDRLQSICCVASHIVLGCRLEIPLSEFLKQSSRLQVVVIRQNSSGLQQHIFAPGYISFSSVVYQFLRGHTHKCC